MENVYVPSENSAMSYPEVTPGATKFAMSDDPHGDGTIRVTVHGIRRLLRLAKKVFPVAFVMESKDAEVAELYAEQCSPEVLREMMNESSSIWCEDDLVMSRLFVANDGTPIAHKDAEIDARGIPPVVESVA